MEAILFRTGSGSMPVQKGSVHVHKSSSKSRVSVLEVNRKCICRAEPDKYFSCSTSERSCKRISGKNCVEVISIRSLVDDRQSVVGEWSVNGGGGGGGDRRKVGVYYEEMLKSNPSDSLLLRNYGKFLHEVEGDMEKAEGYYGRAILANPGDGEILSLYGKLIWEKEKDELRAKSYFDQALHAAPDDCMVLGSYAQFMWEAKEDEDEDEIASSVSEDAMAGVLVN